MDTSKGATGFRELNHVALVVRDIDKAVAFLTSLGIGTFEPTRSTVPTIEKLYRGKPATYSAKVCSAKIGNTSLEIIQPVEGKSPHTEYLAEKGEGVYHIGFEVDDIEKAVAKVTGAGGEVILNGKFQGGGGFAYVKFDALGGMILELAQNWR